jgi:catalase
VLYDAVAVVVSDRGAETLARDAAAREFVTDAYAHCKVIGYVGEANPLLNVGAGDREARAGDDGIVDLRDEGVQAFLERCRAGRVWAREDLVHQT